MKGKSLLLLFFVAGCSKGVEVDFQVPDACCYETHDGSCSVEVSGDATQTSADTQPVDASQDTTEAKD